MNEENAIVDINIDHMEIVVWVGSRLITYPITPLFIEHMRGAVEKFDAKSRDMHHADA